MPRCGIASESSGETRDKLAAYRVSRGKDRNRNSKKSKRNNSSLLLLVALCVVVLLVVLSLSFVHASNHSGGRGVRGRRKKEKIRARAHPTLHATLRPRRIPGRTNKHRPHRQPRETRRNDVVARPPFIAQLPHRLSSTTSLLPALRCLEISNLAPAQVSIALLQWQLLLTSGEVRASSHSCACSLFLMSVLDPSERRFFGWSLCGAMSGKVSRFRLASRVVSGQAHGLLRILPLLFLAAAIRHVRAPPPARLRG